MKENQFNNTYVALTEEEKKEIASIRKQYAPQEKTETKMERLRKLDARVKNVPTAVALALGIIGLLVFGLGMTTVLEWLMPVLGVALCIVGAVPMGLAYPVYNRALQKGREKAAPEILRLTDELMK